MPKKKSALVRLGSYARLSRDDGEDGVSNSIVNQQQIIRAYCERNSENLHIVREYADDGYSGTTFDRPGWQSLYADLESGVLDGFIVKDSSRFCRNFIDGGMLLEKKFPKMNGGKGIRVIMINDGYDSKSADPYTSSLMMAFKGLFNDNVSRDTSVKTRTGLHAKMQRGLCCSAFAPYGYTKDPKHKGHLAVDRDAARNVRWIFEAKLEGMGNAAIAASLNERGVASPLERKREQGIALQTSFVKGDRARWDPVSVQRVLTNEVYVGTLVQGRTYTPSFRSKKLLPRDESEWFRCEGAHEAIVSRYEFDIVQDLLERDTRTPSGGSGLGVFSGVLICAECGEQMVTKRGGHGTRGFCCGTHKRDSSSCSTHWIMEDMLIGAVLSSVNLLVRTCMDMSDFLVRNRALVVARRTADIDRQIAEANDRQERALHFRHGLVDDLEVGTITKEEYTLFADAYAARIEESRGERMALERQRNLIAGQVGAVEEALEHIAKTGQIDELTRRTVVELIDRITVHEDRSVDIAFRVEDALAGIGLSLDSGEVAA